ncbi:MAG TPA: transcriptional regulator [Cyanobacteria bacterium UBA9971]|nr:transcriptional regulator [Cyanobacteria bacterium UBA9971]
MNKEFYKLKSSLIKTLANPTRLMIVDCLRKGEKTVSDIVKTIQDEQSNVSKNLSILKNQGIIKDRKVGLNVYYSLKCTCIKEFFGCLDVMISENLEYQQELINNSKKTEG